jgi:hypothetical protein
MAQRHLDDWIDGYTTYLESLESPKAFLRWSAIATVAGALQRKCRLKWELAVDTYPNMYVVLVGPPAIGKGMAMSVTSKLLKSVGAKLAPSSCSRQALIDSLNKATNSEMLNGTVILHSSITIVASELSVFFVQKDFDLISYITKLFDCEDDFQYKTVSRGDEYIQNVFVNMLGATTPQILQKSLPPEAIGGGLLSRMVLVYGDKKGNIVPLPFMIEQDTRLYDWLEEDLDQISCLNGYFTFSPDIIEPWLKWYDLNEHSNPFKGHQHLEHYGGRRKTHFLKLMMICSASRSNAMHIELRDFERALQFLTEAEKDMPRVFSGYGRNELAPQIKSIIELVKSRKQLPIATIAKLYLGDLDDFELTKVVNSVCKAGVCRREIQGSTEFLVWNEKDVAP